MPTVYRGKSLEWEYGNRLINFDGVTFAYDYRGHRLKKNDIEYRYDNDGRVIKQSNGLQFLYDNTGVAALKYGSEYYFYRKDVQGNIIALIDSSGAVVVRYEYDAWGNHSIIGDEVLGNLNPFRYRSYYYDTETGLYYLQTRYYDPETGRFISQDSVEYADPESINGLNLYAYCGNNPVMYVDPTGTFFLTLLIAVLAGAVLGAIVSGAKAVLVDGVEFGSVEFWGAVGAGALVGGALGLAVGLGAGAGAIVTGKVATLFGLGKVASVGIMLGTAVGVNFVAGMAGYVIEANTNPNIDFDVGQMFMSGFGQAGKAVVNFGLGGIMGGAGFWKLGNMKSAKLLGVSGMLTRTLAKNLLTLLPNFILNDLFKKY